jgi:hypothetical protein
MQVSPKRRKPAKVPAALLFRAYLRFVGLAFMECGSALLCRFGFSFSSLGLAFHAGENQRP